MSKLLQVNTVINSGSTGHIVESIGELALADGWKSYIAYGRNPRGSSSIAIKIGNKFDILFHVFVTRLFDLHGLVSRRATKCFIKQIKIIEPDIIHLHNIHGYYLNYKLLFRFLAKYGKPVVWTMHDCWAATGHCPYYAFVQCVVWQTESGCKNCPQKKKYPSSFLFSAAHHNFMCKKKYFTLLENKQLTIVCPSVWLAGEFRKSFLNNYTVKNIYNGIDTNIFCPKEIKKQNTSIILGVASVWDERKGLKDFLTLSKFLKDDEEIILIGVTEKIIENLPSNIKGIKRTENKDELAEWYSKALVYFNASIEETFGMTCVEAQACGTPVIVYNSTALPETISEKTGILIEPNNVEKVYEAIKKIKLKGKSFYSAECRKRAVELFDEKKNFRQYIDLYNDSLKRINFSG